MLAELGRSSSGLSERLGRLAVERYALGVFLVLAVAAANLFIGLGATRLDDSDEARYGVSAYEMLVHRAPLVTTYAGEPEYWNLKPPLGYWPIALSFAFLGPSLFALRLPSALCGLAVVAVTLAIGRRWGGRRVSLVAGLIMATAYGFLSHHGARSGDLDAALTLLLLLAVLQIEGLDRSPWRIVGLAALLSLGFLLKSFAILPMALVAAIWAAWSGAWRRQRPGPCLLAALVFLLPIALWAAARWHADGSPYFLERMVEEDLLARSTRVIDKVTYSPWGYAGGLLDRLAPWPLLVGAGAVLAARRRGWRLSPLLARSSPGSEARLALLLLWAVVPLVLFSLARTQHHWYSDPIYPAWAVLAAMTAVSWLRRTEPARRGAVLAGCVALPLLFCQGRVVSRIFLADPVPESQRFLMSLARDRVELGPRIRTGPLYHSERFILEAMGGFEVEEMGVPAAGRAAFADAPLLTFKGRGGPPPPAGAADCLVDESRDYALYSSQPAEVLAQSTSRERRSIFLKRGLGPRRRALRAGRGMLG